MQLIQKTIGLLIGLSLLILPNAFGQKKQSKYLFKTKEGRSIDLSKCSGHELEEVAKTIELRTFGDKTLGPVLDAILYRLKHKLDVTETTISIAVLDNFHFGGKRVLDKLHKYDYPMSPSLIRDMMGLVPADYEPEFFTDTYGFSFAPTYQSKMGTAERTEEIIDLYVKAKDDFYMDILKMSRINARMGDWYRHSDPKLASTYYSRVFTFPYYKFRLGHFDDDDSTNDFKMSTELFCLQVNTYKKKLKMFRGDAEALKILTSRLYKDYIRTKEMKKLVNGYLEEVGLEPLK